jgi:perosamine synthetase
VRRQLPVHSPLSASAVLATLGTRDPRPALSAALQAQYGALEAVLTASGTEALTLALRLAMARRPRLPVVLPAFACYDLASAAIGAGASVRLYDVDPSTLAPEPASLDAALDGGAAAIVVVHLFGIPVPMDAMRAAASRADAMLIEDAAQAVGGRWHDRPLGSSGDLAVLSFGRGKGETGGGGGALLVHEDDALARDAHRALVPAGASSLRYGVKLAAQWGFGRPAVFALPHAIPGLRLGETVYHPPVAPRAMPAVAARVLGITRPMTAAESAHRASVAARYLAALGPLAARRAATVPYGTTAGWLRFPVRVRPDAARDRRGAAIGVAMGYPLPLHALPALRPLLVAPPRTPGADLLARVLRTVPTHSFLSARDEAALIDWMRTGEDIE